MKKLDVKTADGTADCYAYAPAKVNGAVLFYMDGIGLRPVLHEMAARLSDAGYFVLLPNMYYRAGAFAPFDPAKVWSDESERARLKQILGALDNASAMRDTSAFLDVLVAESGAARVGCVGYCLGGRLSFLAAGTFPERIAAAASFHGGQLVTAAPDSPHLLASKIRGRVYLGVADNDASFTAEHQGKLAQALAEGHVRYAMELYAGKGHGFAVRDLPTYDEAAAATHWERQLSLFREALAS